MTGCSTAGLFSLALFGSSAKIAPLIPARAALTAIAGASKTIMHMDTHAEPTTWESLAGLPDAVRLPLGFDSALLQNDLARLEATAWTPHFIPENYDGDWSVLPLRAPATARHPIQQIYSDPACRDWIDTPWLQASPAIAAVLARFDCLLTSVRLMRLTAGSTIKEHSDPDLSADYGMARLHVPVVTNPQVDFQLNGNRIDMAAGECWYLNLSRPHTVINCGTADRVHLVIDAMVNTWLAGELSNNAAADRSGSIPFAPTPPGPAGSTTAPELQ